MAGATLEVSDVQWTRKKLTELAAKLDHYRDQELTFEAIQDDLQFASLALRFAAAMTAQGQCRQEAPYEPLYRIRKINGEMIWTCGHKPPHESPA